MTELWSLEQAWERLRLHIEWADQFWLVFIFTDDPRVIEEMRRRVQSQLEDSGRTLVNLRPTTADKGATLEMLEVLVEGRPDSVAWVDLVRHDSPESSEWHDAWQYSCMQLNQRREVLRRQWAQGGIVLSTTLDRLDATPGTAPDLWTIRALLLRLATLPAEHSVSIVFEQSAEHQNAARDIDLTLQALDRARRAVEAATSDTTLANLARALITHGKNLASMGHPQEALTSSLESVDILRKLVEVHPDAFLPDLAKALNNLGLYLRSLGRHEEALDAAVETVQHYRQLADANTDTFLPLIATALMNLGLHLNSLGRREEAIDVTLEAIQHYRKLAGANSDYLPFIAKTLSNVGVYLSSLGRHQEGFDATLEAIQHYRKLADASPDVFLLDLARSLNNLGADLNSLGRREEAIDAALESIQHYRELANQNAEAVLFEPAMVFFNLGTYLASLERHLSARDHYAEGLRLILPYFEKSPAALAGAATWAAQKLSDLQHRGVAIPETLAPTVAHLMELTVRGPPWSEAELERVSQLVGRDLQS